MTFEQAWNLGTAIAQSEHAVNLAKTALVFSVASIIISIIAIVIVAINNNSVG